MRNRSAVSSDDNAPYRAKATACLTLKQPLRHLPQYITDLGWFDSETKRKNDHQTRASPARSPALHIGAPQSSWALRRYGIHGGRRNAGERPVLLADVVHGISGRSTIIQQRLVSGHCAGAESSSSNDKEDSRTAPCLTAFGVQPPASGGITPRL